MCKVLIRQVHGNPNVVKRHDADWQRWEFTVTASIDGGDDVKAIVKTFDESVKDKIILTSKENPSGPLPIWEAEPYDKGATVSYTIKAAENTLIVPHPRRKGKKSGHTQERSNHQVAFESANALVSAGLRAGKYESPEEASAATLVIAEKYLEFLQGGAK